EWRSPIVAKPAGVSLPWPPGFLPPTEREFTIVVRIEDRRSIADYYPDPVSLRLGLDRFPLRASDSISSECFPRPQCEETVGFRINYGNRSTIEEATYSYQEKRANAVIHRLEQKLMELHEKGCFEVELSLDANEKRQMRIRYQPAGQPSNC